MADIKEPFALGAEEVRIRVSRYDDTGKPACYQVWIDHKDRTVARSVGILASPEKAWERAMSEFNRNLSRTDLDKEIEDLLS